MAQQMQQQMQQQMKEQVRDDAESDHLKVITRNLGIDKCVHRSFQMKEEWKSINGIRTNTHLHTF